jgi:hypothetical protein
MLKDIIAVQLLKNYQLHLTFEDDRSGIVDLIEMIEFTGIFEPIKDPEYLATVRVDLDPVVLYTKISHPDYTATDIRDRLLPSLMSGKVTVENS